jgi:tetratricopeptide (TPR) repeat protein
LWSEALGEKNLGLFSSPGKRSLILCLLLTLLVIVLYNPVAHYQFVNFDDDRYVTDNPHVSRGLSWGVVSWAFVSTEESNWHPLTWLSHALDCQLFHLNPAGHHYVNLLFHLANVLLLFLLLQIATGFTWRSFMVAALFGVHPLNVESVVWIAERKNVLCVFFFLLTLGAYGWYVRSPNVRRYVLVAFLFILGLMTKPMVITLPFVLLLLDYWPLGRTNLRRSPNLESGGSVLEPRSGSSIEPLWRLLVEKIPLLAFSAASAIITMKAQKEGGAVRLEYPAWERFGNAFVSYAAYLAKAIYPVHLAALYPHPGNSISIGGALASAVLLIALTVVISRFRRFPYVTVGWFWFLGTMVPVIGLIQVGVQAMADRYTYIPFIGLFVMVIWGFADWAAAKQISSKVMAATAFSALAALSTITHFQESYWHDSVTLWEHAIAVTGPNFVAQDNLGGALVLQEKYEDAIQHFEYAAEINPQDPLSQLNIGVYEAQHGKLRDAMGRYQFALSRTSDPRLRANAFSNLAGAYRRLHDYARARDSYESALRLQPDNALNLIGLGIVAQKSGELTRAIDFYSKGINLGPTDVGYLLLAQALEKSARADDAKAAFAQAQTLSKDLKAATRQVSELLSDEAPPERTEAVSRIEGTHLPGGTLGR